MHDVYALCFMRYMHAYIALDIPVQFQFGAKWWQKEQDNDDDDDEFMVAW